MHSFIAIVCCKLTYRVQVDGLGGGGTIVGGVTNFFFFFFPFQSFFLSSNACLSYQPVQVCFLGGGAD